MKTLIKQKHGIILHKNGLIELTSKVSKDLSLHHGDIINFKVSCEEIYLYKSSYGIKLYSSKKHNSLFLRGYSIDMCNMLLGDAEVAKFRTGEIINIDNELLITIITLKNYAE